MDKLSKVKVLTSFLKTERNLHHALICLTNEAKKEVGLQDWIRESGNLDVIISLVHNSTDSKTKRLAIYCLAACLNNNYDSQLAMSSLPLFSTLCDILENSDFGSVDQYVSLMLLLSISDSNPCAQELVNVSGCLDVVLNLYGRALSKKYNNSASAVKTWRLFTQLLVHCIKSVIASPPNCDSRLAVSAHPAFCDILYNSLSACSVIDCDLIRNLCDVIGAVYCNTDDDTSTVLHRDMFVCSLCSKLQSVTKSRHDLSSLKLQKSISCLVESLVTLISSHASLLTASHEHLDELIYRLIRLSSAVTVPELRQNIMYLLINILDKPGTDTEKLSEADGVRRLYRLTQSVDDPVIHCAVSYILLGVNQLNSAEMKIVQKLAPASLVRMGLSLDKAKQMVNGEHVNPKTRKQLFETNDIMDLMSSDDEPEDQYKSQSDMSCELEKSAYPPRATVLPRRWKQLTPPSKLRSLANSPGWKTRVKRLKSLLKHRRNSRNKATRPQSGQENVGCEISEEKTTSGRSLDLNRPVRQPFQIIQ